MKCPNCGQGIEKGWSYCPRCGARFRRDFFSSIFDRMFSRMNIELRGMDRLMEKNIEALDISPFFSQARAQAPRQVRPLKVQISSSRPRRSGFSVRITRSGRNPPRVSVRTFGNINKERVREQLGRQLRALGLKERDPRSLVRNPPGREPAQERTPESIEEPRTEVRRLGNSVAVNLEMPGVKSLNDIDIKELESSLEVKARAGKKAYFKILTKPGRFRLAKRGFSEGVLHLEFS